jgi:hypothetical protein
VNADAENDAKILVALGRRIKTSIRGNVGPMAGYLPEPNNIGHVTPSPLSQETRDQNYQMGARF